MLCINQMIELENQHNPGYLYPVAPIHLGHTTNFQQPNMHTMMTASGSSTNFDAQYLPERYDNQVFYGTTQYNSLQHHHNLDLGVATPGSFYYSFMPPSSSAGMLPVPLSHGASDQLSSSGGNGVVGISADEFGRNNHFLDCARGPCKRKVPESVQGNYQHFNASATSSSSNPPLSARHLDGVSVSDPASFPLPWYVGNGNPPIMEVGPPSGARSRLVAAVLDSTGMHDHNHLAQGNYMGQHFQPSGMWLEQHLSSSSGDGGGSAWNRVPSMPFMHGSIETASLGMPRYHEAPNSRSSQSLRHPPAVNHRHQNHHALAPMLGPRGHNNSAAASHRFPSNSSRSSTNPSHNGFETGHRQPGTVPPTGIRIYRPHRGSIPEANLRQLQLPHLRYLHADEVAILEIPDLYEVGEFDHHSDLRLDIEDMSYEELLALGERIGNVNTGLSEEVIANQLKTTTYLSRRAGINLEEDECPDKEIDSCIICQDDYVTFEKIGVLGCGHEYHAECLKKWLLIKNVCPICKSEALSMKTEQ